MPSRCTVCDGTVTAGDEHWANAWERSRKRFACCSDGCAAAFRSDRHWLPSRKPAAASEHEGDRLYAVLLARIRDGDSPSVVTREMLQAGVAPERIRGVLIDSQRLAAASQKQASEATALGIIGGLLTGWFSIGINRDQREPRTFEAAFADLDRWDVAMRTRW